MTGCTDGSLRSKKHLVRLLPLDRSVTRPCIWVASGYYWRWPWGLLPCEQMLAREVASISALQPRARNALDRPTLGVCFRREARREAGPVEAVGRADPAPDDDPARWAEETRNVLNTRATAWWQFQRLHEGNRKRRRAEATTLGGCTSWRLCYYKYCDYSYDTETVGSWIRADRRWLEARAGVGPRQVKADELMRIAAAERLASGSTTRDPRAHKKRGTSNLKCRNTFLVGYANMDTAEIVEAIEEAGEERGVENAVGVAAGAFSNLAARFLWR